MSDFEWKAEMLSGELDAVAHVLSATVSGEWIAAEELLGASLALAEQECDVSVDVEGADHLDAATLQILLALHRSQKKRGRVFGLVNASPALTIVLHRVGAARALGLQGWPDA